VTLLPAIVLGGVMATLVAALVHWVRGRTMRDFVRLWVYAQIGFWLGHGLAVAFNAPLYTIGDLQIIPAAVGSLLATGIAIVRHK
jgi:hypothetical protein